MRRTRMIAGAAVSLWALGGLAAPARGEVTVDVLGEEVTTGDNCQISAPSIGAEDFSDATGNPPPGQLVMTELYISVPPGTPINPSFGIFYWEYATVDWGDGATTDEPEMVGGPDGNGIYDYGRFTHEYEADGEYTVTYEARTLPYEDESFTNPACTVTASWPVTVADVGAVAPGAAADSGDEIDEDDDQVLTPAPGANNEPAADDGGDGGSAAPVVIALLAIAAAAAGATALVRRSRARRPDRPDEWVPVLRAVETVAAEIRSQLERGADTASAAMVAAVADLDDLSNELQQLYDDTELARFLADVVQAGPLTLASLSSGPYVIAHRAGQTPQVDLTQDVFVSALAEAPGRPPPPSWQELDDEEIRLVEWSVSQMRARIGVTVAGGSVESEPLVSLRERTGAGSAREWLTNATRRINIPTTFGTWVGSFEATARLLTEPEVVLLERALEVAGDPKGLKATLGPALTGITVDARLGPWRDVALALGRASGGGYAGARAAVQGVPRGIVDVVTVVDACRVDTQEYLGVLRSGLYDLARSPLDCYERLSSEIEALPAVRRAAAEHRERLVGAASTCAAAHAAMGRASAALRPVDVLASLDAKAAEIDRGLAALEKILATTIARDPVGAASRRQDLSALRGTVSEILAFAQPVAASLRSVQRTCDRLSATVGRLAELGADPVLLHPEIVGSVNATRDLMVASLTAVASAAAAYSDPSFDWSAMDTVSRTGVRFGPEE